MERCVELRRRREDHRQNLRRLEAELAEARAFQQSLLPDRERSCIASRSAAATRPARRSAATSTTTPPQQAGPDGAADRRRVRPRRLGGDAHRHRQERLPRLARRWVRAAGGGPARLAGAGRLQPRAVRHAGRGADLTRRAPACATSAPAIRRSSSGGRRARQAVCRLPSTGPLVSPVLVGSTCGCPGRADRRGRTRACCTPTASRRRSPTRTVALKSASPAGDRTGARRRRGAGRRDSRPTCIRRLAASRSLTISRC